MDTEVIGPTMSPSGLRAELMASMRDMDTEGSTLGLTSAGLAEDIDVKISVMTLRERIRFPIGDTTTVMVTGTPAMAIPVTTTMMIAFMVAAICKHSLGWKRDRVLTQAATVMRRPSSMMTTISMTTISRSPMARVLDLRTAPDQGKMAFGVMVALKGIDIEVTAITIVVGRSASAMEASTTITQVLHHTTGLISRVTTNIHNRQGLNNLGMDVPTMKSWACLRVWTKQRRWPNELPCLMRLTQGLVWIKRQSWRG